MNVLIIGGGGFIGPHVAQSLRSAGAAVTVLTRTPHPGLVDVVPGNREDLGDIRHIVSSRKIDTVIDLLAYAELTTVALLDALEGAIKRYVLISSCDVYRNYGGLLKLETPRIVDSTVAEDAALRTKRYPYRGPVARAASDPQCWLDTYDKIPIEEAVRRRSGMEWCILRLPMVFGPNDRQRRFSWVIRPMVENRPAVFVASGRAAWRTTYGYVADVGDAIALASSHPAAAGQIYNVGYPDHPTEKDWIARFADRLGWKGQIVETDGPSPGERLAGYPELDFRYPLMTATDKVRRELGYVEATTPSRALDHTIEDELRRPRPPFLDEQFAAEDELLKAAGASSHG